MNQVAKVAKHLAEGNPISGLVAERNYGIERLPSRINDLCERPGWRDIIERRMKTAPGSGKRYMEYRINSNYVEDAKEWFKEDFQQA